MSGNAQGNGDGNGEGAPRGPNGRGPNERGPNGPGQAGPGGSGGLTGMRPSQALIGVGVLLAAMIFALAANEILRLRSEGLSTSERVLVSLNRVLVEQAERAFQSVELVLRATRAAAGEMARNGQREALQRLLQERIAGVPVVRLMAVMDDSGQVVASSRAQPLSASIDYTERGFFQAHRESSALGLRIGEPVRSRMDGRWFIPVSLRLAGIGEEDFGGVILAQVDPGYFQDLYQATSLGEGSAVGLFRRDGLLLAHSPHHNDRLGKSFIESMPFRELAPGAGAGSFYEVSPIDHRSRLTTYGAAETYPLVVTASMDEGMLLGEWRANALRVAVAAIGAVALEAGLVWLVLVQVRRWEETQSALLVSAQALQQSDARYREIINTTTEGYWLIDPVSRQTLEVNDALCRMLRYRRQDLLGKLPTDFTDEENARIFREQNNRIASTRHRRYEINLRASDGRAIPTMFNATTLSGPDGRPAAAFALVSDVSAIKEAKEALRRERDFIATVLDMAAVLVVVMDRDGHIMRFNRACEVLTGLDAMAAAGRHYRTLLLTSEHARVADVFTRLLSGETPVTDEHHWLDRSGEPRLIAWSNAALFDSKGRPDFIVAAGIDITERQRHEAELVKAWSAAEAANQAKSNFLAAMSHELRTPLNSILGFAELIRDQAFGPVGVPRYAEYANDIFESGRHLLDLITDILDLAKIEAGRVELELDDLNVLDAVRGALSLVRERAERQRIALACQVPTTLPTLYGDARAVKQILLNLLSNALKFTPAGGRVVVAAWPAAGGGVALSVADTGQGISPERLERLFRPFEQGDNRYNRASGGTGLGLALVKGLTEAHGGKVGIDSVVGSGTTVTVTFPPAPAFQGP